jgi:hypothetical protein
VIPPYWEPYERQDDGELLGYLEPVGERLRPVSPFGHPLAEAGDRPDAESRLEELGLRYLAEPWLLDVADRPDPVRVRILEVRSDRVVLQEFVTEGIYSGERYTLEPPVEAGRLTPERPLR